MNYETLLSAQNWFASMGYDAEIFNETIYLFLEGFSVELSHSEIEARAEQFENESNR